MSAAALPEAQVVAAQRCASCPKMCRSACPTLAVTANERHQPWGHACTVVAALGGQDGFAEPATVAAAFACATCGACTVPCLVKGVETTELSWAVRAAVFDAGATPAAGLRAVAEASAGRVRVADSPPAWTDGDSGIPPDLDPPSALWHNRRRAWDTTRPRHPAPRVSRGGGSGCHR